MSLLYRRIGKLPNYLRVFGVFRGLRLLVGIERRLDSRSDRLRRYDVGWARAPIWLRDTVSDHAVFWQCLVAQHYNLDAYPHTRRLLKAYEGMIKAGKTPIIVDGGGNIGLSAIWFAHKFPKSKIIVVEPEQSNFDLLLKNVDAYRDIIHPIHGAVWPRPGTLTIKNPDAPGAAIRVADSQESGSPASGGQAVRAYTIDELLSLAGGNEAFLVKLDIEGSQKEVFQENTGWVGRSHLIILELDDWHYPWKGTSRPFFKCLSNHPFEYLLGGEHIVCFQDLGTPP
jgi:FkbM family methyltransferase